MRVMLLLMVWAREAKAVTINPAEIFGVSNQLGSLEAGKQANLFTYWRSI